GVAFIDPRSSQVDIIQAVGRAIRLSPDKKAGTIVLPVFIAAGQNAEDTIEASYFKPIWDVLNALKAHDDVLACELDKIRTELGRKPGAGVSADGLGKIRIDLPATVDANFGSALRTYLVEQVTASWNFWFGLLEVFVEANGNARVPYGYVTPEGYKLGLWVIKQRAKSKSELSQDRIKRLESLSGWSWDPYLEAWEDGFGQLEQYVNQHGNARCPRGYVMPDGYKLGQWVGMQRRPKTKNLLSQYCIRRLESLSGWSWDPYLEAWEDGFGQLEQYVNQHGNARVSRGHVTPEDYRLGQWIGAQRESRSKNQLSQDRIERLGSLPGWSWVPLSEQWEEGFKQLTLHGNARVSNGYVTPEGYRLSQWVSKQRESRSKNKLSQDRIERLDSLPGWSWNLLSEQWEEGLKQLEQYVNLLGNARVPKGYVNSGGYMLGNWVSKQRVSRSKNQLSQDRIERLESLPGWVWRINEVVSRRCR
ncbi:MAG: Helicase associated domain protein, partial [Thiothrix sp.]|uniref:helicase associated domain-containing protein n=1 Tax=Thiothrix sp. TaxID=1032 RepID=UPI002605A875